MIVPNKAIPYTASLLPKLPILIQSIDSNISPIVLYRKVQHDYDDLNQFMLALDTLYILKKVDYKGSELNPC